MKKRIISMLMVLLMVLSLMPTMAFADTVASGTCGADGDNLTWTLDSDGVLTISGEGRMADFKWDTIPWYTYRTAVKNGTISDGVTSIGEYVFCGCSGLTSVIIPDSVTDIADYAFEECSSLTSVVIPNSVTSIGESVFWGCSNLQSVTIPDSVTSIGENAFYD